VPWHRQDSLLNGDLMSRLLYRALDGMTEAGGRLDGAELIMRLLARQSGTDPAGFTEPLRAALTAILAAEQPGLTAVPQVSKITTISPNEVA